MSTNRIEILEKSLKRERAARKAAENILEDKSRELYFLSEKLKQTNQHLTNILDEKSRELVGFFENILDAYVVINLQGNVLNFNNAAVEFFGNKIKEKNLSIHKLVWTEDRKNGYKSFKELLKTGHFKNFVTRVVAKNHEIKWVQLNASIIYDKNNIPIAAQSVVRDITSDKEAEDLLIESESRLSSLIMNLDSAVLLENEKREIILTNKKFCELFNIPVSPDLLVGQDCSNAAEQSKHLFSNSEKFVSNISEIYKNKQQVLGDELQMKDGTILERDFIPIFNSGEYKGHLWTYKNITLKRQYRKSLEAQKQKYSNIIANMNLGLLELNNNEEIALVNQSFCDMSGYTEEELLGNYLSNFFDINSKEDMAKSNEMAIKDKQGNTKYWLVSSAPNYNLNGTKIGAVVIYLDISEFKKLELQKESILKELAISNDELKEYAHVVSHDLKSPLGSINALVTWIKMDNKGKFDDTTLQNFSLIEQTLETMENLISSVLEYSSIGKKERLIENVNLNEVIQEILKITYVPSHIDISIISNLPIIKGEKIKYQQVFQNLISNAIKFTDKEKGIITINCIENENAYQFSVSDNGIGIEKKYYNKIFEIFHSLNKSKESTGIGLSIVKKNIDLLGGKIWLESSIGQGSTFYFTVNKN